MPTTTVHNPDQYMADLRQMLSQGRKRIGIFIGAGAPTAIRVGDDDQIVTQGGRPLIPDVKGLTTTVIENLSQTDRQVVDALKRDMQKPINIETILTKTRQLAQAIGSSSIHDYDGNAYDQLSDRICKAIGAQVRPQLPSNPNPYSDLVSWISGTQRLHSVEIFTPNYDLLLEDAFERARIPFFDGFTGSHRPFFDPVSVLSDDLPSRWSRLWKLHGSIGWAVSGDSVIRTDDRRSTNLIYPEHRKYDQATRLPFSALFERLRQFLTTPDTLMICSGFSFADAHISAVMDESLAANAHTAVLAFQYKQLAEEEPAATIARSRPNISVYAKDGAVINGIPGPWRLGQTPSSDWQHIRGTFWGRKSPQSSDAFLLGDFAMLTTFLALIQAREVTASDSAKTMAVGKATENFIDQGSLDA
ncbi:MAG: SIR2 family protein [Gammaproteobacteria bacterium]|nr:SIR2 family protein [Gammaproteobacteria bacterium]